MESTEAASTGSVGVRHAAIVMAVTKSVSKRMVMKSAQMSQPNVMTGPSKANNAYAFLDR